MKRNLLRLHWVVGVAWMLVLAWMCLLAAVAAGGQPTVALTTFILMQTLNLVALGLGVVVLLFALAYGVWSAWGFGIHHNHWILAQWVLVLGTAIVGATLVRAMIAAGIRATSHGVRIGAGSLTVTLMLQVLALMAVIVIGVRKPGGRKSAADRGSAS